MTTGTPARRFEDRLLAELEQLVSQGATSGGDVPRADAPRKRLRRVVLVCALALITAGGAVGISTLDGSRAQLAQAAVIARAEAALARPGAIVHVSAEVFTGGHAFCLSDEVPLRCLDTAAATAATGWLRTYSYEEWLSGGDRQHTIYDTRDETVIDGGEHEVYDPADNTVTTTFFTPAAASLRPVLTDDSIVDPSSLTIADIRSLYQQAQGGRGSVHLVGQRKLDGQAVYELSIGDPPTAPAKCSAACASSVFALLLFVNSHTFLPVRAVFWSLNVLVSRTDYRAQLLADTPSNQQLLQTSPHPGARRVRLSHAQLEAELTVEPSRNHLSFAPPPRPGDAAARQHRKTTS